MSQKKSCHQVASVEKDKSFQPAAQGGSRSEARTTEQPVNVADGLASIFKTDSKTVRLETLYVPFPQTEVQAAFRTAFAELTQRVDQLLKKTSGWVKVEGGGLYAACINAVLPKEQVELHRWYSWPSVGEVEKGLRAIGDKHYPGVMPTEEEIRKVLSSDKQPFGCCCFALSTSFGVGFNGKRVNRTKAPGVRGLFAGRQGVDISNHSYIHAFYRDGSVCTDSPPLTGGFVPVFRLTDSQYYDPDAYPLSAAEILTLWCCFDVVPTFFAEDATFKGLSEILRDKADWFEFKAGSLQFAETAFVRTDFLTWVLEGKAASMGLDIEKFLFAPFLACDVKRANILPEYPLKQMESPDANLGHWDLWAENSLFQESDAESVAVPVHVYARNPVYDIHADGVIGIDFGTKNTTVVRRIDQQSTKPMRIGRTDFNTLPTEAADYENPTVIQFINVVPFQTAYGQRAGRPLTSWSDVTISHTAADRLKDTEQVAGDLYTSFLSELKQWAGGRDVLRVKDKVGNEIKLPPYGRLTEEDQPDPIEIYAYYLGLNINHMRNGIYLRYELSYPVTYDKDILERLRQSFERGIRKSLPMSILNDAEVMKSFYVRFGASEPAAYSLCALQEYGFSPSDTEQVFYGVFDFGGGTTDFDFGIFREATEDEQDNGYEVVLEHFRPGGDKYLGGENLLQVLAYEVLKNNAADLLQNGIMFARPFERDNTAFDGEEGLVGDSPEAYINLRQVMECLRPLWEIREDNEEKRKDLDGGVIKPPLFDKNGVQQTNLTLNFEVETLKRKLRARIQKGVTNFFLRLKESLRQEGIGEYNQIHIFLAGNSSRSPLVTELFNEGIKEWEDEYARETAEGAGKHLILYPPLGTPEAEKKMKERKVDPRPGIEQPTGKTGVAFGLVRGRDGSEIKIVDKNLDAQGHIAFRFYLGKKRKGCFQAILSMETEVGKWERVMGVGDRRTVELHYSDLAEAGTNDLPIEETKTKVCVIDQPACANQNLYVRIKSSDTFEWAVAPDEAGISESSVRTVVLD